MKKLFLLLTTLVIFGQSYTKDVLAQDIVGSWLMEPAKGSKTETLVSVFEHKNKFYAYGYALVDGSESPLDSENRVKALRTRPLSEVIFLYGVSFENGMWINGEIYRPTDGSYFFVKGKLSDKNTLEWRASIDKEGVFGNTQVWKKASPDVMKKFENRLMSKDELIKLVSKLKYYKRK
ncbi:MAG: DUF2147 domain-containing protein [Brevinema sp.]